MSTTTQHLNAEQLREDFPILAKQVNGKRLAYLDNSATTQKPRQVLDAMNAYYETQNANVHRGIHKLSEEATIAYEEAHKTAAQFINAQSMEEIIFTKNTTESLNLAAYTLTHGLQPGDEILLTQMEHHSNLVPWQQLAKQHGLVVKYLTITDKGELNTDDFSLITDKTKVVALTHMSNVLGTINPVKEIAGLARDVGAVTVIDAAQSVPHFSVDVQALGVDFLAFSGHKMLGPTGIGVLYGRKQLLQELPPFLYGGDMIREVRFDDAQWNDLPWKFEAGTPNIAEAIGLEAAMQYLTKVGMNNVFAHEQALTKYAWDQLQTEGVELHGPPPGNRGGVLSFNVPGVHAHDVSTILDQDGVAVRGGHHCAMPLMGVLGITGSTRASLYLYNTQEDIDAMITGIKKTKEVFA